MSTGVALGQASPMRQRSAEVLTEDTLGNFSTLTISQREESAGLFELETEKPSLYNAGVITPSSASQARPHRRPKLDRGKIIRNKHHRKIVNFQTRAATTTTTTTIITTTTNTTLL